MYDKLYEYYTGRTSVASVADNDYAGQTFTIGAVGDNELHRLTKLILNLSKWAADGITIGTAYVDISETSGGLPSDSVLATVSFDGDAELDVHPANKEITFNFTDGPLLRPNIKYAWYVRAPNTVASWVEVEIYMSAIPPPTYPGGSFVGTTDGGGSWSANTGWDCWFKEYGFQTTNMTINGNATLNPEGIGPTILSYK